MFISPPEALHSDALSRAERRITHYNFDAFRSTITVFAKNDINFALPWTAIAKKVAFEPHHVERAVHSAGTIAFIVGDDALTRTHDGERIEAAAAVCKPIKVDGRGRRDLRRDCELHEAQEAQQGEKEPHCWEVYRSDGRLRLRA